MGTLLKCHNYSNMMESDLATSSASSQKNQSSPWVLYKWKTSLKVRMYITSTSGCHPYGWNKKIFSLRLDTDASGRWPVNRRHQFTKQVAFSPLWGQEYWLFEGEGKMEQLKLFSLYFSPFVIICKICKQMLQWNQGKSGQIFNSSVSVYKMFLQVKKHEGNNEKKAQNQKELPASSHCLE